MLLCKKRGTTRLGIRCPLSLATAADVQIGPSQGSARQAGTALLSLW